MWVFTTRGFFSAVVDTKNEGSVLVRARIWQDIESLRVLVGTAVNPTPEVIVTKGSDYPFRIRLSQAVWAWACHKMASEIDYANFKGAVDRIDPDRHGALMDVWSAMRREQTRREAPAKRTEARGQAPLDRQLPELDPDPFGTFDGGDLFADPQPVPTRPAPRGVFNQEAINRCYAILESDPRIPYDEAFAAAEMSATDIEAFWINERESHGGHYGSTKRLQAR